MRACESDRSCGLEEAVDNFGEDVFSSPMCNVLGIDDGLSPAPGSVDDAYQFDFSSTLNRAPRTNTASRGQQRCTRPINLECSSWPPSVHQPTAG